MSFPLVLTFIEEIMLQLMRQWLTPVPDHETTSI